MRSRYLGATVSPEQDPSVAFISSAKAGVWHGCYIPVFGSFESGSTKSGSYRIACSPATYPAICRSRYSFQRLRVDMNLFPAVGTEELGFGRVSIQLLRAGSGRL